MKRPLEHKNFSAHIDCKSLQAFLRGTCVLCFFSKQKKLQLFRVTLSSGSECRRLGGGGGSGEKEGWFVFYSEEKLLLLQIKNIFLNSQK